MEQKENMNMYRVQASIHPRYAPTVQRGKYLHEQVSKSTFPEKRKAGHTNLDLWLDGTLYPRDVQTLKRPKFTCLKELLEFVGDGPNGLLGYITNLEQHSSAVARSENAELISTLKVQVLHLQSEIQILRDKLQDMPRFLDDIKKLQAEKMANEERVKNLQMEVHVGYAEKLGLESECRSISEDKEKIQMELSKSKSALKRMAHRLDRLKKTPLGYRSIVRKRQDLSSLVQSGGHAKAQKRLARSIVGSATTSRVQLQNAEEGRSGRLYGQPPATANELEARGLDGKLLQHQ